ncbi:MAG TPA: ATP-binding protein [Syntrophorhabdaceae bacterium]|nr:ATP-binding protein [Syntrophorhabdaceae bacterium]
MEVSSPIADPKRVAAEFQGSTKIHRLVETQVRSYISWRGNLNRKYLKPDSQKAAPDRDISTVIEDLRIHQTELEAQNEELRRAQSELEESRTKYSDLYDFSPVGYLTLDKHGLVKQMNITAATLLGVDRNFFKGTPFHLVVANESKKAFWDHQLKVLASSKKETCDVRLVRKNGTLFDAHLEWIRVGDTHPVIYCVLTDITDRKMMEDELVRSRTELEIRVEERTGELSEAYETLRHETEEREKTEDQLRQAQKMEAIGTLAGGIAHDFNNILAGIMGFSEMIDEDLPDDSPHKPRIEKVLKAATRARDLVRQILAFSRKSDVTRKPVAFSTVIAETIHLLRASLPSTIDVKVELNAAHDTVLSSPSELQQILMNLATNSLAAMREKGGTLSLSLTNVTVDPASPPPFLVDNGIEPREYVSLIASDTGVGIQSDILSKIFEPFFTTKQIGEGTGLGLAVVYGIVKTLRGEITVESQTGKGSTFRIFLPVAPVLVSDDGHETDQVRGGTENILFVDDEDFIVSWGHDVLERLGYKVTATTNPIEALSFFTDNPTGFDLVIVDQTMPTLTGSELAQKLLAIRKDIPIILTTGHSDILSEDSAKRMGIQEFLMKPVGKRELAQAIRKVLE